MSFDRREFPMRFVVRIVLALIILIGGYSVIAGIGTTVNADEIVIKQGIWDGQLTYWTASGFQFENFGKLSHYKKSAQFAFEKKDGVDGRFKIRFNDGGHAMISGSLRFELPLDQVNLEKLHSKFGTFEAIEQQLLRPVVDRAIYMSGPLMSSKESAAERRSDLLQFVEDQVKNGVYKSDTENNKEKDPISGQERTITRVKLVQDAKSPNGFARQENSPLAEFGVKTYSFSINDIDYDDAVEKQIGDQQTLTMDVQKSIAGAKKAEQDAITAEQRGKADAAEAKWKQEVLKATEVTKAEQQAEVLKMEAATALEVQRLAAQRAELFKKEQTLIGEGEAARRKAVMLADGALDKKLDAYVKVQTVWAQESSKQRQVPDIVFGGNGGTGSSGTSNYMDIQTARAARDLGIDLAFGSKSGNSRTANNQ